MEAAVGYRPWLHRLALLTAAATLPLLVLGGLVTSMRVGLADPEPVRAPWYMLLLDWRQSIEERGYGYLIEHSHRQLGWIVGVLVIVLTVWLLAADARRWVKGLGALAFIGVGLQGVLGILRVHLESAGLGLEMAMVHGILGPLVFALLVCLAVVTGRDWLLGQTFDVAEAARFRRVSKLTCLMAVLQMVAGVLLRQIGQDMGFIPLLLHLFFGLAVVAHVVMLWVRVGRWQPAPAVLQQPVLILLGLMVIQVFLGMAAWVYGGGAGAAHQALQPITVPLATFATSHTALGALLLAWVFVVAIKAGRHLAGGTA